MSTEEDSIYTINKKLGALSLKRQVVNEELQALNKEFMRLLKKKWKLERLEVKIKYIPTPRRRALSLEDRMDQQPIHRLLTSFDEMSENDKHQLILKLQEQLGITEDPSTNGAE